MNYSPTYTRSAISMNLWRLVNCRVTIDAFFAASLVCLMRLAAPLCFNTPVLNFTLDPRTHPKVAPISQLVAGKIDCFLQTDMASFCNNVTLPLVSVCNAGWNFALTRQKGAHKHTNPEQARSRSIGTHTHTHTSAPGGQSLDRAVFVSCAN